MPKGIIIFIVAAAALMVSAAAYVNHSVPKHRLRKRRAPPVYHPPEPAVFLPEFDWEQEEYLSAHNAYRQIAGVPPLVWDANLTAAAKSWANLRRVDCNYRRHSPTQFGESIFYMNYKEFAPKDVVQWWHNEHKLYDNTTFVCKCYPVGPGCECGHYLNIIWSGTRRVGCSGATYCHNQKGLYVVCNYDPPGLTPGINPFTGATLAGTI